MSDEHDEVQIVHIPSLVATLLAAERKKGAPLVESEVIAIRDSSPARAVRSSDIPKLIARRGYEDIDPENCWVEWQQARVDLRSTDEQAAK